MAAGEQNFIIEQGSDFRKTFTWTAADGNPVDLSGYTISLQAAKRQTSSEKAIDISTQDYITIDDADNGIFSIAIPGNITAEYDFFNAVYQIKAESAGGYIQRLLEGEITLAKEVA